MEELLVSLIIKLCENNVKDYRLKDEVVSCQDYYVNCTINNKLDVKVCMDKAND